MLFKHYKGGLYRLVGEARHSETGELLVIYVSVETGKLWARPVEMFYSSVTTEENKIVPRFLEIEDV